MFMLKVMARRQVKYEFNTEAFKANLDLIAGTEVNKIAHPDTLAYVMRQVSPENISEIRAKMVNGLIRMRCLEKFRLLDEYYMIAVDMTEYMDFGVKKHCEKCMTRTVNGMTYYHHSVLEAKLITPGGMALSVETEFVENEAGKDKQDCELRAFYRLEDRLKKIFPQLKICLLLDSLYANRRTFDICGKNGWKYIVTFKEGSMPQTYREAMTIKRLQKNNRGVYENGKVRQEYSWATEVDHEGRKANVLECDEYKKGGNKRKKFVWLTNLCVTKNNYAEVANNGGRCRWKIENEGFNMQKNGGYNLEHMYCGDSSAMKNFYYLLQIAHFISQLMEKGSLLKERIKKIVGGIRNLSRRLLEELRTEYLTAEKMIRILAVSIQIRFDST